MTEDELDRLYALLRVPSVSALPEHGADMARAAALVADEVRRAGGHAEVRPGRHPLVVGEVPAASGDPRAPRVLLYGHYDVQPAGDPALWTSPPFAPEVRDGALYARGASDDKGNLFMMLAAVQRLAAGPGLPVRVGVVVDGEEESGGDTALRHLAGDPEPAVAALIFDTAMAGPERPMVCAGLRGLVYRRVRVRTGVRDAHSGMFGGAALNAAHALMRVLDAVLPRDGRLPAALTAGAVPPTLAEREAWAGIPAGARMLAEAGMRPADAAAAEEFYARTLGGPSLDVHGLACGDPGAVKTNIPCEASATLSLRVAPGQDAHALAAALDRMLHDAAPAGAEVHVEDLHVASPALLDPGRPEIAAAVRAIAEATGWPCVPVRSGGTIPVVATLAARGVPVVLTGFGLPDDAIHAPDEHLRFDHLETGTRAAMQILVRLGELHA